MEEYGGSPTGKRLLCRLHVPLGMTFLERPLKPLP